METKSVFETLQDCGTGNCSTFSKRPHTRECKHFRGELKTSELCLADVVDTGGIDGFSTCIVIRIVEPTDENKYGSVTLFRPYATTSDFSYTAGVIPYIGIEQFEVFRNSGRTWKVVGRRAIR